MTKTITISKFKTKCLELIDEIANSKEELIITENQKPIAKLTPYQERPKTLRGQGIGQIKILRDIMQPLNREWDARKEEFYQ